MADKKMQIQVPGIQGPVEAVEVAVEEATERWTDVKLSDGTQLRLKSIVLAVVRIEGRYDPDGNPLYQLKSNQLMTVTAPDHLKKGAATDPKTH